MSKQTFLQGTLILIAAGMITRFLGFVNRMVVARMMGEEGVGLYMMALPTLFLIIALTQFGLPVAISKRVAEAEATNNRRKVKQILVISLVIVMITSIVFTTLMILFSPFIASTLLTDERTALPLIAISPIVPIVAVSSVLRGYFQGKQNMKPQSYSQVIEQVVRIACVALFVKLLLPFGVEYAAAGAMFSVILGEFISLLYMLYQFKQKKTIKIRRNFFAYLKSSTQTCKELFSIALPTTGSRMIGSVSYFLEPIIVAQSLALAGVATALATKQYGELTGYALPLLFLPTFITQSLSVALVPSIAEAEAQSNHTLITYRIRQAIRLSFASGAIATVVLILFSVPILQYMYGTSNASSFIMLLAPFFLFLYIQSPLQAALQALDLAKPAMWNSLIGNMIKFAILFFLASNPAFGIMGVAISMAVGVVLVTLMHLFTLKKEVAFQLPAADILKMIILLISTSGIGMILKYSLLPASVDLLPFLFVLIIFLSIYISLLFILRFISKDELAQLPIFNRWIKIE
ncbi:stage V sporulation protein B [Ornithinibacillus gellani]|uniref:stage V sporulation protein B n=1 Tax=Ornithinibacillus gellani TaxID=2293253 RepID=UPI000F4690DF|nr:stage V sporulation protein B [Ornithinibacillus gellani]TQS74665.1 stage V sporulation protein B [Ornithinibacillus gellani]